MQTHIVTADQVKDGIYIGTVALDNFIGHIHIAAHLGTVFFKAIKASGRIRAEAGSGIKAGSGIEAGLGIKAGEGIEAGSGIEAGLSVIAKWVNCPLRIFVGLCLWREPAADEMELRAELRNGTLCFGTHVPPVVETEADEIPMADQLTPDEVAAVRRLLANA